MDSEFRSHLVQTPFYTGNGFFQMLNLRMCYKYIKSELILFIVYNDYSPHSLIIAYEFWLSLSKFYCLKLSNS